MLSGIRQYYTLIICKLDEQYWSLNFRSEGWFKDYKRQCPGRKTKEEVDLKIIRTCMECEHSIICNGVNGSSDKCPTCFLRYECVFGF